MDGIGGSRTRVTLRHRDTFMDGIGDSRPPVTVCHGDTSMEGLVEAAGIEHDGKQIKSTICDPLVPIMCP